MARQLARSPCRLASVVCLALLADCAPRGSPGRPSFENGAAPAQFHTAPRVWHVRLPTRFRPSLPCLCRLSEQFDLLEVRSARQWREFARAAGIEPDSLDFDFTRGRVLGIVSYVGDPLTGTWPMHIEAVGCQGGWSWIQGELEADLYYALRSPGYCTFTYLAGRSPVGLVKVGHRVFFFRS